MVDDPSQETTLNPKRSQSASIDSIGGGSHRAERLGDPSHRTAAKTLVSVQSGLKRLAGRDSSQQAHAGP